VLIRELIGLYQAFAAGAPSPLPDLPLQYADYAAWQRQLLQGELLEKQLAYWREQLAGSPALELPADYPRPVARSYAAASEQIRIPARLAHGLREVCRREGVTMFMVLLSAWQVVLGRWAGQEDVVVGTDVANRLRPELESLVGFFVNQLVIRTDLKEDPTVRELLARVRKACLAAYDHQDVPFDRIVEELLPDRDLGRNPLFQVMFVWQNLPPLDEVELPGLRVRSLPRDVSTVKFDLTLTMSGSGEELAGFMDYSTELFKDATVRQMLRHFERVLEQFAAEPEKRLSEIDLLSEQERALLLMDWSKKESALLEDAEAERLLAEIEHMETDNLAS
jgi:non-ribosomal peptide synthetase component F